MCAPLVAAQKLAVQPLPTSFLSFFLHPYISPKPAKERTPDTPHRRPLGPPHNPPAHLPLHPPTIRFTTPICHPNIHFQTGEICLDLLKTSWSPAYTISSTLTSVHQLLTSAEPDSPLNIDIAQLFRQGDMVGAEGLIRFYVESERWRGW